MGCDISSLLPKGKDKKEKRSEKSVKGEGSKKGAKSNTILRSYAGASDRTSLAIPVPGGSRALTPSPHQPYGQARAALDDLVFSVMDGTTSDDHSSSSSAPLLFRISPTNRAESDEGSWRWWMEQVRRDRVTRDRSSRGRLQDVQGHLARAHDEDPTNVELDLGRCYMERTAPYILGALVASPGLRELRWVTSLRLDGNYFTDHGLGNMLATMSAANERRTIMPLLEQLYLSNMNLDPQSVAGILFFLFPVDFTAGKKPGSKLSPVPEPSMDFAPLTLRPPRVPLFPSLSILSLSDNPGVGAAGLAVLARWLLAAHIEPHVLSALDLSRCGIDHSAVRVLDRYFSLLPGSITDGRNPVMPRSLVLLGNAHGIANAADVSAPAEIRLVL